MSTGQTWRASCRALLLPASIGRGCRVSAAGLTPARACWMARAPRHESVPRLRSGIARGSNTPDMPSPCTPYDWAGQSASSPTPLTPIPGRVMSWRASRLLGFGGFSSAPCRRQAMVDGAAPRWEERRRILSGACRHERHRRRVCETARRQSREGCKTESRTSWRHQCQHPPRRAHKSHAVGLPGSSKSSARSWHATRGRMRCDGARIRSWKHARTAQRAVARAVATEACKRRRSQTSQTTAMATQGDGPLIRTEGSPSTTLQRSVQQSPPVESNPPGWLPPSALRRAELSQANPLSMHRQPQLPGIPHCIAGPPRPTDWHCSRSGYSPLRSSRGRLCFSPPSFTWGRLLMLVY
jgi:hypothetical protein